MLMNTCKQTHRHVHAHTHTRTLAPFSLSLFLSFSLSLALSLTHAHTHPDAGHAWRRRGNREGNAAAPPRCEYVGMRFDVSCVCSFLACVYVYVTER